jgi:hypothetical protein
MVHFSNIARNWDIIVHPTMPVYVKKDEKACCDRASSLAGRVASLAGLLGTPFMVWQGLGKLVLSTVDAATRVFSVLTFNSKGSVACDLKQAAASLIVDVPVGAALLPVATLAWIVRGAVGTIFHPGVMVRVICREEAHAV